MIHKLRRKFIFTNMTIVTLLLIGVLGAVWFSSYHHMRIDAHESLCRALDVIQKEPPDAPLPPRNRKGEMGKKENRPLTHVFAVEIPENGTFRLLHESGGEFSSDTIAEAVAAVPQTPGAEGKVNSLSLRYLTRENGSSLHIAFVDVSHAESSLKNLALTCLLVFAGSMLVLFFISYFLSRWALRPVEEAWNQQNQFIADASHELKTPLTVILANLKILLAHKPETISSQERWIRSTQSEAESMKKLVEELLFLARSDAHTAPSEKTLLNLSDLTWNTILLFEPVAYEQGITLEQEIMPDLMLSADVEQMKRLLSILLDNACKYAGEEKQVTLTLSRQKENICLTVQNTGNPISPEELPHLFERFYRSDKSRSRIRDGYGLGLSIAQAIVQGHGGKITAASTEKATCFSVLLPL